MGVADPQVLGLPLQLFLLSRLRERAHLWAELVTGAVLRGCEAQQKPFSPFGLREEVRCADRSCKPVILGYAEKGDGFCNLGEGLAFVYLLNNTEHSLDLSRWAVLKEPLQSAVATVLSLSRLDVPPPSSSLDIHALGCLAAGAWHGKHMGFARASLAAACGLGVARRG